jgi:hypothetical protein
MELITLANKHKNKILQIAVILLSLIIANNIYKKKVSIEIEKLKQRNQMEEQKIEALDQLGALEKKLDPYKDLLAKKEAGSIINTINSIAKESGLKIISVRPAQEQKFYGCYSKSSFNLILTTPDFHAVGKFINRLENYQDVYLVESIDIKSRVVTGEQRGPSAQKELTVNLVVSHVVFIN